MKAYYGGAKPRQKLEKPELRLLRVPETFSCGLVYFEQGFVWIGEDEFYCCVNMVV